MTSRRDFLTAAALAAGAAIARRAIPSTGEPVPVIGMGTSGSFEVGQSAAELDEVAP